MKFPHHWLYTLKISKITMKLFNYLIATCLFLFGSSILAHTGIESSSPANGAKLNEAPQTIDLSFKGPVRLLKIEVKDARGNVIDLVPLSPDAEPSKSFSLPLPDLQTSAYKVNWMIASADGHKIKGKFAFKYLDANGEMDVSGPMDQLFSGDSISAWVIGLFLNKLLIYIALAMTVGGLAALFTQSGYKALQNLPVSYLLPGCLLGIIAASAGFFLQVGSFAEMGIAGMWSHDYLPILWDSGAGKSYRLQLLGWLLVIITAALIWAKPHINPIFSALAFVGVFIIAFSFTLTGHTAETPLWIRIALIVHVVTAMWWIGSLYPLRRACKVLPTSDLQSLMVEFGQQAMVLVGLLAAVGVGVAYHLVGSFSNLLFTGHGNILLLKLASVAAILLIAAKHKWRLVPGLTGDQVDKTAQTLKGSITIEMLIGLIVLLITAALSSLVGPARLMV